MFLTFDSKRFADEHCQLGFNFLDLGCCCFSVVKPACLTIHAATCQEELAAVLVGETRYQILFCASTKFTHYHESWVAGIPTRLLQERFDILVKWLYDSACTRFVFLGGDSLYFSSVAAPGFLFSGDCGTNISVIASSDRTSQ